MNDNLTMEAAYLIRELFMLGACEGITTWKVSGKWVNRNVDCSFDGIRNGCMGSCCKSSSFWPPKASGKGACAYLNSGGCTLEMKDRPVTCLIYPLMLNRSNTLIYHYRALSTHCKKNYGRGEKVLVSLKNGLSELFGEEIVDYLIEATGKGVDPEFEVPRHVIESLRREGEWSDNFVNPQPRSLFSVSDNEMFSVLRRIRLIKENDDVRKVIEFVMDKDGIPNNAREYIMMRLNGMINK